MMKGIDSVHSSGYPNPGHGQGLRSLPVKEPPKKEPSRQVYEDPLANQAITRERIYNILQALKSYSESARRSLKFHVHEETNRIMVQIIAKEDGRVIREIPAEALLDLEARIEEMTGVLFSKGV